MNSPKVSKALSLAFVIVLVGGILITLGSRVVPKEVVFASLTGAEEILVAEKNTCDNVETKPVFYGKYKFPSKRDLCYQDLANATKVWEFCSKINDQNKKNNCFVELAVASKDLTVCEMLENDSWSKSKCYFGIALKTLDRTICTKIEDKNSSEFCRDRLKLEVKKNWLQKKHKGYQIEPIESWKIYNNIKYGYEIKYPSKFTVEEKKDYHPFLKKQKLLPEGSVEFLFPETEFQGTKLYKAYIKINVGEKILQGMPLKEEKVINGILFRREIMPDCSMGICLVGKGYYTKRNDIFYEIMLWQYYTNRDPSGSPILVDFNENKLLETLEMMLFNFRFTE